MSTSHTYIDSGATAISLYIGFRMPILAAGLPHYTMMALQGAALCIGIITGILTTMNMLGYVPMWLKKIKRYFKKISND